MSPLGVFTVGMVLGLLLPWWAALIIILVWAIADS